MDIEIRPDPDEAEREAILAALAAAAAERPPLSPWVQASLPERDGQADEP